MHLRDAEGYALDVPVPNNDLGAQIQSRFAQTGRLSKSPIIYLVFLVFSSLFGYLGIWKRQGRERLGKQKCPLIVLWDSTFCYLGLGESTCRAHCQLVISSSLLANSHQSAPKVDH